MPSISTPPLPTLPSVSVPDVALPSIDIPTPAAISQITIPAIPVITMPSLAVLGSVLSSPLPGLDLKLAGLDEATNNLKDKMKDMAKVDGGIASQVGSLKSQLIGQVAEIKNKFSSLLSGVELPTSTLQGDIIGAFRGGLTSFIPAMTNIQKSYPSVDMTEVSKNFTKPDFKVTTMVPNVKIIDGKEVEKAIPEVKPTEPVKIPDPSPTPPVVEAPTKFRFGVLTQADYDAARAIAIDVAKESEMLKALPGEIRKGISLSEAGADFATVSAAYKASDALKNQWEQLKASNKKRVVAWISNLGSRLGKYVEQTAVRDTSSEHKIISTKNGLTVSDYMRYYKEDSRIAIFIARHMEYGIIKSLPEGDINVITCYPFS